MSPEDAARRFVLALAELDARQERLGLPALNAQEMPWSQRADEVECRLYRALVDDPPNLELLEAAGAHLLSLYVAAFEAHNVRVDSGDPLDVLDEDCWRVVAEIGRLTDEPEAA